VPDKDLDSDRLKRNNLSRPKRGLIRRKECEVKLKNRGASSSSITVVAYTERTERGCHETNAGS